MKKHCEYLRLFTTVNSAKSIIISSVMLLAFQGINAELKVKKLRVEGVENPIGIDIIKPKFSWQSENPEFGTVQDAYEITINEGSESGDPIWSTGKVISDKSIDIYYEGTTLKPSTRYYWNVKVWDNKGNAIKSAEKSYFETGLMNQGWDNAIWIKSTEIPVDSDTEKNEIKSYSLTTDFEIKNLSAGVCFAKKDANNYCMWQINLEDGYPRLRPHIWTNGAAKCYENIDLRDKINITLNKIYNLRIEVKEDITDTYINDILVDSRINPLGGDYGYGEFGIRQDRAWANYNDLEQAYFDNFKLMNLENNEILYFEDFSNPENNRFTTGTIESGRLFVAAEYSWIKPLINDKYDFEFDMIAVRDAAGIIFSAENIQNMFMWGINFKEQSYPFLRRHIRTNGNYAFTDTPFGDKFTKEELLNKKHRVKISVGNETVKTYINDILIDTFEDKSGRLHNGKIGYRSYKSGGMDELTYYDNVKLTVYDDANPNGTIMLNESFEEETNNFSDGVIVSIDGNNMLKVNSESDENCVMQISNSGIPVLRKEFNAAKEIKSAKLYSSALGIYDMFINGERVANIMADGSTVYDELKPGWTDYFKEIFYVTHDVTHLVKTGANAIGAQIGTGWWAGAINKGIYGNPNIGFMAKLVIKYADNSEDIIVTDTSWKSSFDGPVLLGDIYDGETYDARRDYSWATAGYNDSKWNKTEQNNEFKGIVTAYQGPIVKVREEFNRNPILTTVYSGIKNSGSSYGEINIIDESTGFKPVKLKKGDNVVFDLGQNMVGWINFSAKGAKGTKLTFKFGEMLNDSGEKGRGNDGPKGSVYTYNLRTAKAKLNYIMSGNESGEKFAPTNTFYGFRYCELTATDDVEITGIVGEVLGSDIEEGSLFETSHKDVNQLYSNVMWGQRGNFLSIPTDCPQRDERLGWTGDTQIFSKAAAYNGDVKSFYHKWMTDMRNSQRTDGAYPDIAPFCWFGFGNAAWGDAGVIVPWTVYQMYGDKSILTDNFESMENYMKFLSRQVFDGYNYNGAGVSFGDWLAYEQTDSRYISVTYYAYVVQLMEKICNALSSGNDNYAVKAADYKQLYRDIRTEFNKRYVNSDGTLKENTQTSYLLALKTNLFFYQSHKDKAIKTLRQKIVDNGYKLSTGFVGTGTLNITLSEYGLDDIAYDLLLQRENPSWLYSIDQGATTIWERWDSYTKEKGFNDHPWVMNSFNHYSYGAVTEWMYRYMAGIEADDMNPGFKHFYLRPVPDTREYLPKNQKRITYCNAVYNSQYGDIESRWNINKDGNINYEFVVPMNTSATICIPVSNENDIITINGSKDLNNEYIEYAGFKDNRKMYNVKSGSYIINITQIGRAHV